VRRPAGLWCFCALDAKRALIVAALLGTAAAISASLSGASRWAPPAAALTGAMLGFAWSKGYASLWLIGASCGALGASILGGNQCDGSLWALPGVGAAMFGGFLRLFPQYPPEFDLAELQRRRAAEPVDPILLR
jgi:hypothetical protein